MEVSRERDYARLRRALKAAGLTAAAAAVAPTATAHAGTITVDTLQDGVNVPGVTTLREAIIAANTGKCNSRPNQYDDDTIKFASGLTGTITLQDGPVGDYEYCAPAYGEIPIYDDLKIEGPGADKITVSGGGETRLFVAYIPDHRIDFEVDGLTLANGFTEDNFGAAIWALGQVNTTVTNSVITGNHLHSTAPDEGYYFGAGINQFNFPFLGGGPLVVENSVIKDNVADGDQSSGGGISGFSSPVTIENSTIAGNHADGSPGGGGGGLDLSGAGFTATINGSTISGNESAEDGGGISAYGIDVDLNNSTIYGNHADGAGGGAVFIRDTYYEDDQAGTANLRNVTVAHNTAGSTGGILRSPTGNTEEKPTLTNTIVADNTGGSSANLTGNFNGSFNLLETAPASFTDLVPGSTITGQDPKLGPLQNNGGPTKTSKPAVDSAVVDKGRTAGSVDVDQRGLVRPFDVPSLANSAAPGADGADIGAVELGASETPTGPGDNTPPTASFTFSPTEPFRNQIVTFHSTSTDSDGTITKIEWDLDDNGTFERVGDADPEHGFPSDGPHDVTLRVTDDDGAQAQVTHTLVVKQATGNVPPFAGFKFSPASPAVGQNVTFNSNSSDSDGSISSSQWDLDGDGQYNDANGPSATRSFSTGGAHTVSLLVTDNAGAATQVTKVISVSGGPGGAPPGGGPGPAPGVTERDAFDLVKKLRKCNKKKKKKAKKKCRRKALKKASAASRSFTPEGSVVRNLPVPVNQLEALTGRRGH